MIGFRRPAILAIAALVVAGCGATPGGSPPGSSADEPSPTPGTTAEPTPTSQPSIVRTLANSCQGLPADYSIPTINVFTRLGRISAGFGVESVVPLQYPEATFTNPSELHTEIGALPGGYDIPIELWLVYEFDAVASMSPIELVDVDAELHVEGAAPVTIQIESSDRTGTIWNLVAKSIPDVDGVATIDVAVEWTDRCFTYSGDALIENIRLASSTTTAGCRMTQKAYRADLEAALSRPLFVGADEAGLASPFSDGKYLPVINPGIDVHPASFWDRDATPITAAPGAALVVRRDQPDFQLITMQSMVWTRRSFAAAADEWPPTGLVVVLQRTPQRQPDGSFRFRVPNEPGRYVARLSFEYDWTCATGTVWAVFSLTVLEPTTSPTPSATANPAA